MTLKSPLIQVTSMLTRAKQEPLCFYTRGFQEVSLQLSELHSYGACLYNKFWIC